MRVLVVDNYDSFTFNLVQYLGELGASCDVVRNDALPVEAIAERGADALLISPGPCTPRDAGISIEVVRQYAGVLPLLGVCLGHQSIGAAFGGTVVHARELMHGKTSEVFHEGRGIFLGLPSPFTATRYHSLAVASESLPSELVVTARTEDGEIMGLAHVEHPVFGVQFHPESILTKVGKTLLQNFLDLATRFAPAA